MGSICPTLSAKEKVLKNCSSNRSNGNREYANFHFLRGKDNLNKSDTPPRKWFRKPGDQPPYTDDDLKERLRPKLACTFAMTDSECVHSTVIRAARAASGASGGRITSFRLKVAADRIGSVDGCRGRLVSIRRDHEAVLDGERLILPFLPSNAADATGKRIDAGVPELLEFLQISDRNTVDVPAVARSNAISVKTLLLQPGDYTFVIIVSSPESATTAMPVLHWSGDWKTASVTL